MELHERVARGAIPLPGLEDSSFAESFDRYAGKRVVLLGECSHGTSEFYRARAAISRRLVETHGFDFVAVEADWPDAAAVDALIGGEVAAAGPRQQPFQRFPRWMWRNREFAGFVGWMREFNAGRDADSRVGFHGLDIYNLSAAITTVLAYLDQHDPEAAKVARERYGCLMPWQKEPAGYGQVALARGHADCEKAVVAQCMEMLQRHLVEFGEGRARGALLDAAHSARLVAAAERYYRLMYYAGPESWNARDSHMFETLDLLLEAYGPDSKGIVWAHNSHIGDAANTEMGAVRDEINIGQLCRDRYGEAAALVGFGTHDGTVMAAHEWDGEAGVMRVRPSLDGSVEALCHQTGLASFLLDMEALDDDLRDALSAPRPERFIGVIYRPDTEYLSHYARVLLPRQFDGYAWFDRTQAVHAVDVAATPGDRVPDTFPFGV